MDVKGVINAVPPLFKHHMLLTAAYSPHDPVTGAAVRTYCHAQLCSLEATFCHLFLKQSSSRWTALSVRDNAILLFLITFTT